MQNSAKFAIAKMASKAGLGLLVSAAIGIMIKAERQVDDRIDAHFDAKDPKKQQDSDQED